MLQRPNRRMEGNNAGYVCLVPLLLGQRSVQLDTSIYRMLRMDDRIWLAISCISIISFCVI